MKHFDVCIIGGGFSGVCAAIAASREGSRVLLIEKGNALGGAAANALVLPFMSYHTELGGKAGTYLRRISVDGLSAAEDQIKAYLLCGKRKNV